MKSSGTGRLGYNRFRATELLWASAEIRRLHRPTAPCAGSASPTVRWELCGNGTIFRSCATLWRIRRRSRWYRLLRLYVRPGEKASVFPVQRRRPKAGHALRRVGFDYIFDTTHTADLTIMEEGSEFIERFTHKNEYNWPYVYLLLSGLLDLSKPSIRNT